MNIFQFSSLLNMVIRLVVGWLVISLFLLDYKYKIATYVDDYTSYTSSISLNLVSKTLESSTHDLFRWFKENYMKANPDECHLLVTTNALISVKLNGFQITNTTMKIFYALSSVINSLFKNHLSSL